MDAGIVILASIGIICGTVVYAVRRFTSFTYMDGRFEEERPEPTNDELLVALAALAVFHERARGIDADVASAADRIVERADRGMRTERQA